MHDWQIELLSRVEVLTGATRETKLTRAVKQFCYDVGAPHFPAPKVRLNAKGGVDLTWERGQKTLVVAFHSDGLGNYGLDDTFYEVDPTAVLGGQDNPPLAAARWLMSESQGVAKERVFVDN